MKVVHRLPAVATAIDDESVTVVEVERVGDLCGHDYEMAKQGRVCVRRMRERFDGLLRDYEHMHWRLRSDIVER